MANQKVIGALLVLVLSGNLSNIKADLSPEQFTAGAALAGAGVTFVLDQSGKWVPATVGETTGLRPRTVATSASTAVATGILFSQAARPKVLSRENMVKTGLSTVVSTAVFSKTCQNLVRQVPGVGYYLTCDNPDCQGVCGQCQNTKALQATAISVGINLIPQLKASNGSVSRSSSSAS